MLFSEEEKGMSPRDLATFDSLQEDLGPGD